MYKNYSSGIEKHCDDFYKYNKENHLITSGTIKEIKIASQSWIFNAYTPSKIY